MIRQELADALALGTTWAIGIIKDGELVAVGSWKIRRELEVVWQVLTLGTDVDHRKQGLAEQLKREIMRRAKEAGIRSLVSLVDRRNAPMIALNRRLGGKCVWDWRDPDYSRCAVRVR